MQRWMTTRRSAKLQNIVVETDADEERKRERLAVAQKNSAVVPDDEEFDRYAYEDYDEPETKWSPKCPSNQEMSYYLEEMKMRGIPINTAYDILSDHDMNIDASLKMIIDNDLVPVELMDSNDKLMLKAIAPLLGTYTDSKRRELFIGQTLFPGLKMTAVYEEAFKQRLELLSSYTGDIEKAKTVVKRQMAQLSATKSSPVNKCKKSLKRKSTTPETHLGKVPRMSESPNTSNDSADFDSNSLYIMRESASPDTVAPRNVPAAAKPIETPVLPPKIVPHAAPHTTVCNPQQNLQALLAIQLKLLSQLNANLATVPNMSNILATGVPATIPGVPSKQSEQSRSLVEQDRSVSGALTVTTLKSVEVNQTAAPVKLAKISPPQEPTGTIARITTNCMSLASTEPVSKKIKQLDEKPKEMNDIKEPATERRTLDSSEIKEELVDDDMTGGVDCEKPKENKTSNRKPSQKVTIEEAKEIFSKEVALALETLHPRAVAAIFLSISKSQMTAEKSAGSGKNSTGDNAE